jgi:hypothetical protein
MALALVGLSVRAEAAPIVYIDPASQTVNLSNVNTFSVDVLVKDAGEALGGWDIDLSFNDALIQVSSVVVNAANFDPGFADFSTIGGSPVNSFTAGDPAGNNLAAVSPLLLFTVNFQILGFPDGLQSALKLTYAALSEKDGLNDIAGVSVENGLVCFARLGNQAPDTIANDPNCKPSVPEPGLMALMAAGLATVAARRRQAAKR